MCKLSGKGFDSKPANQGGQQAPSFFLWGWRLFRAFPTDFPACAGGSLLVFRLLCRQNNILSLLLTCLCNG